jgi:hypothetical protein
LNDRKRVCGLWKRVHLPGALPGQVPSSRGRSAGPGGLDGVRAVEQRLAAEPLADANCLADRSRGGLVIAQVEQVTGMVDSPWARW